MTVDNNVIQMPRTAAIRELTDDPQRSAALPGYLYSDPAVFETETTRLFHKLWQCVGHASELPNIGDYLVAKVIDQELFVLRGADGQLRAFYNVCQHRAHELLKGRGNVASVIVCPYHAWTYELDGKLRGARATKKMPDFDPAAYGLEPVRLETPLGFLFVNLDPTARPLAELAGDMFADMAAEMPWLDHVAINPNHSMMGGERALLDANWKVLAENCLECYHCGPAHRAFVDMIDIPNYTLTQHGGWMKSAAPLRRADSCAYKVGADEPVQHNSYWHLFPNIEFALMPGSRALSVFWFAPINAEQTGIAWMMLTLPGENLPADRVDYFSNVLWPEDVTLCTSVHRGLKSKGYRGGRFIAGQDLPGVSEANVHEFQRLYAQAMGL
jgi:choline monooxygenase